MSISTSSAGQNGIGKFNWKKLIILLFLYRLFFAVIGEVVVPQFTQLGDSGSYQAGTLFLRPSWYLNSNDIVSNIGAVFYYLTLGSKILINFCFQGLAFLGLYRLVKTLRGETRTYLIILMFLPTFTLWSSVAGKEAVLVFAVATVCAHYVDYINDRLKVGPALLFSLYLIFVMKTHYMPGLLFFFGGLFVARNFRHGTALTIMMGLATIYPLYHFRDFINDASFEILKHFVGFGLSTREAFWVNDFDVFWKAPLGMYQGFFGPNFVEAFGSGKILQTVTFLESFFLIIFFVAIVFNSFARVPAFNFVVWIFSIFWILFPNYPFGVMNPGSAIRYRTGFIIFVFFLFVFLPSRNMYISLRSRNKSKISRSQETQINSESHGARHDG